MQAGGHIIFNPFVHVIKDFKMPKYRIHSNNYFQMKIFKLEI